MYGEFAAAHHRGERGRSDVLLIQQALEPETT
jgi:hypothetical protein